MIGQERPLSTRQKERLTRRLAAYSRYASVVQAQFRALEEEDVSRFSELAQDRQEIQEELEGEDGGGSEVGTLDQESTALLKGAQEELEGMVTLDEEIKKRLLRLRGQLGAQIKAMSQREGSVKQYLTREETPRQERSSRLNVRL